MGSIIIILFPVVFVIHELEEILMLDKWKSGKCEMLSHRYSAIARMVSAMSQRGFAVIAAEETMLIIAATAVALYGGWQTGWYVLCIGAGVHLLVHIGQCIIMHGYALGALTAIITLPYYITALIQSSTAYTTAETLCIGVCGCAVVVINLIAMHSAVRRMGI
ncbi:MAG: HXXEE domain-containing protein [Muribaculaceae bacterium]